MLSCTRPRRRADRSRSRRSTEYRQVRRAASSRTSSTPRPGCIKALREKRSILFEGAQGSLLDVDHGTFPYVTSSNSSGCGIHSGSGVPERAIDTDDRRRQGLHHARRRRPVPDGAARTPPASTSATKATNTAPSPAARAAAAGSTPSPRPTARASAASTASPSCCSTSSASSTRLKICEAYEIDGERTTDFPSHVEDLAKAKPVYRTLPGWKCDISGSKTRRLAERSPGLRRRHQRTARPARLPAQRRPRSRSDDLGVIDFRSESPLRRREHECQQHAGAEN